MAYQTPKTTDLVILRIGEPNQTRQGNVFIECETDKGVVAVWGKKGSANIEKLVAMTPPAKARCGLIDSRWPQHRYWVPETTTLAVLEAAAPPASATARAPAPLLADELNQYRRRILRLLDRLCGGPESNDSVLHRVTILKKNGRIPRQIAALILAVTESRNVAEHQNETPTATESEAARLAWKAVAEWALLQGIDINAL